MPITLSPAELYLSHNNINVYHVYHKNILAQRMKFLFTTDENFSDSRELSSHVFDIRNFPGVELSSAQPPLVSEADAQKTGLTLEEYRRTPEYLELKAQWEEWYSVTEPKLIREAVIKLIEEGKIPRG